MASPSYIRLAPGDHRGDAPASNNAGFPWVDRRVPRGPVGEAPGGFLDTPQQRRLLDSMLAGVDLGPYDRRILDWLAGWDTSTVLTIASLIGRARAGGA